MGATLSRLGVRPWWPFTKEACTVFATVLKR